MIRIFYGENRTKAFAEIDKILGKNHEVLEGEELSVSDLPSIFKGASLFDAKRKILIRDLSPNEAVFAKISDYLDTEHEVIILESKLDKRTSVYKNLAKNIEIKEFASLKNPNAGLVFDILDVAMRDGKKAVQMVEKIENEQDPYMFTGLLISQAIKKFEQKHGTKEKRTLKELSKLDIRMKTTSLPPWTLVKPFLLQVSSL